MKPRTLHTIALAGLAANGWDIAYFTFKAPNFNLALLYLAFLLLSWYAALDAFDREVANAKNAASESSHQ